MKEKLQQRACVWYGFFLSFGLGFFTFPHGQRCLPHRPLQWYKFCRRTPGCCVDTWGLSCGTRGSSYPARTCNTRRRPAWRLTPSHLAPRGQGREKGREKWDPTTTAAPHAAIKASYKEKKKTSSNDIWLIKINHPQYWASVPMMHICVIYSCAPKAGVFLIRWHEEIKMSDYEGHIHKGIDPSQCS